MFNTNNANGYSLADIAAVTNGGFGFGNNGISGLLPVFAGGNNGGFGGDGIGWIVVLFILAALGGWGGFGGFGGGWGMGNMMGLGMMDGFGMFPWLLASNANNQNATNAGFDNLAVGNTLSSIQSGITSGFGDTALGIAGINQNICQTGSGITAAVTNGFAQSEIADNARQIANMQQAFNAQTAVTAGINGLSNQFSDCCCENRLGLANLNSTILSENCADRAALSDGVRDILTATQAQTQRILDQMCNDKIDAKNEKIADLERQLTMANLSASQTAQTARLIADNAAQTQQIENYVRPQVNPAYIVPNPYANYGFPGYGYGNCGCGCGGYGYNNLVA